MQKFSLVDVMLLFGLGFIKVAHKVAALVALTEAGTAFITLHGDVDALQALGIADLQLGEFLKQDYIAAFSNRHVHEEVIKKLDLPYTPEMMATKISSSYSEESHLIYIHAIGSTAEEAILLANTYVEVATYFVSSFLTFSGFFFL